MEFVNYSNNIKNVLTIDKTCSYVIIDNNTYPITKVYLFRETEGKFETDQHIIKYSRGKLFVYDRQNNILETYKFSGFVKNIEESRDPSVVGVYTLKQGYTITLTKVLDKYTITLDDTNKETSITEEIVDVSGLGDYTSYTSVNNNILMIIHNKTSSLNNKFNGIPVSK